MVKRIMALCCLAGIVLLSDCAAMEVWDESDKAPISPSQRLTNHSPADGGNTVAVFQPDDEFANRTLTLAECISIALERNPQAAGSWQAARAAAARTGQAKSEYLPTVGFTSSVTRGDAAELDGRVDPGAQDQYDALFGVRYLLFDGGGRNARVQGAEAGLLAANFRY
ncbi:MAG: TolC family protein, partial [bacterium]